MQAYSDPKREAEPTALPDIEVFWHSGGQDSPLRPDTDDEYPAGWYWWSCFPGCLPDGEPMGPFATKEEALADARDGVGDAQ